MTPTRRSSRRGLVLVVVLVAIALLSLAGYTFAQLMFAEREAATAHARAVQARASVDSGAVWIEQQLAQLSAVSQAGGRAAGQAGDPTAGWYDNPSLFRGVLVADSVDDRNRARFTVLAPRLQYGVVSGVRYGLEDESARLNLNTLLLLDPSAGGTSGSGGSGTSGSGSSGSGSSGSGSSGSGGSSSGSGGGGSGSSAGGGSSGSNTNSNPNAQAALMNLPGMTYEIADAILDWLDADDDQRPYGAERSYYVGQSPAYAPKNGPFASVEELLLVRGVTPQLLFGADADRNGFIDAQEAADGMTFSGNLQTGFTPASGGSPSNGGQAGGSPSGGGPSGGSGSGSGTSGSSSGGASSSPIALPQGAMNQGWSAYLTVYSQESNLRPDGQLKINLNGSDLSLLQQQVSAVLGPDVANFVVAFRQGSPQALSQNSPPSSASGVSLDLTQPGNTQFASPADLIGVQVQTTPPNSSGASGSSGSSPSQGSSSSTLVSPYPGDPSSMAGYSSKLFDYLSIVPTASVPGRINPAYATLPVLMGIPGMDTQTASLIQAAQQTMSNVAGSDRRYSTWLVIEGIVPLNTYQKIAPYLTGGGRVYRSQIVGHFDRGGPIARAEVIIDATHPTPRVLLWRDLGHLGRGYPERLLR
ncbi:MAG TPA: hypothetical protein VMV69_09015 [Pirellulales bacterium]|nr:hypothetical protein [Pirellulales bacterium]